MNKGFAYYFKKSNDIYSFVIRKQSFSNRLSLLLYTIASFIGKLFLFTRPIFLIADQNLSNMMINGSSFTVLKAFHGTKERYFKMLFASMVEFFIYLAMAIAIFLPFAFITIGIPFTDITYLIVFPTLGVIYFVVAFIVSLAYGFVPYVASKNKDLDFSDYLYNSRVSIRGCRHQLFFNSLLRYLLGRFWCDATLGAAFAVGFNFSIENYIKAYILLGLGIVFAVLYCLLVVRADITKNLFVYLLGDDACKSSENIIVKRRASTKVEYEPIFDKDLKRENIDLNKEGK